MEILSIIVSIISIVLGIYTIVQAERDITKRVKSLMQKQGMNWKAE